MSLVELARFHTRVEADLARMRLESAGLHAVLFDADLQSGFGELPWTSVRLMVLHEEREEAAAILREGDSPRRG